MSHTPNAYATLRSAAKYVRQFRQKIFVVKLGGELLDQPGLRKAVAGSNKGPTNPPYHSGFADFHSPQ